VRARLRRSEPLHLRLLREGGLVAAPLPAAPPAPAPARASVPVAPTPFRPPHVAEIHGGQRPREWDAVVTATAPHLGGLAHGLVVLEDGTIAGASARPVLLEPLRDAVGGRVRRPYRAEAVRRGETLWAVSARHVELVELSLAGEELQLTVANGRRELLVDGRERSGGLPELELRRGLPVEYHARAVRVDGLRWELDVVPL
jgi:hypothetical protein